MANQVIISHTPPTARSIHRSAPPPHQNPQPTTETKRMQHRLSANALEPLWVQQPTLPQKA